jgi:hypothetical protein
MEAGAPPPDGAAAEEQAGSAAAVGEATDASSPVVAEEAEAGGMAAPAPPSLAELNSDQPLGPQWVHLEKKMLAQLIMQQQPGFRSSRPLIWDGRHLQRLVSEGLEHTLQTDFCWSLNFTPAFIAQLVWEGFLPICSDLSGESGLWLLMPKWHVERCTMKFSDVHVSKSARKKARRFRLTVDAAFDQVYISAAALMWPCARSVMGPRSEDKARSGAAACSLRVNTYVSLPPLPNTPSPVCRRSSTGASSSTARTGCTRPCGGRSVHCSTGAARSRNRSSTHLHRCPRRMLAQSARCWRVGAMEVPGWGGAPPPPLLPPPPPGVKGAPR